MYLKFSQHPELKEKLLATGNEDLLEANPYDSKYGIGHDGTGQNLTGKCLMRVRSLFQEQAIDPSQFNLPKHPTLNLKNKIQNNTYKHLQEIYTNTKTSLQFIDNNHIRNHNRILLALSSNLNLSKTDIQDFLNDIRAEYIVDCQMANFLKHNLQKSYENCQKFGVTMKTIEELLTPDSQAQKQLDQLLKSLTIAMTIK